MDVRGTVADLGQPEHRSPRGDTRAGLRGVTIIEEGASVRGRRSGVVRALQTT